MDGIEIDASLASQFICVHPHLFAANISAPLTFLLFREFGHAILP
jgi:hypothetical protein